MWMKDLIMVLVFLSDKNKVIDSNVDEIFNNGSCIPK